MMPHERLGRRHLFAVAASAKLRITFERWDRTGRRCAAARGQAAAQRLTPLPQGSAFRDYFPAGL